MIDLDNIKGRNALIRLNLYDGRNPYLIKLKEEYKRKGKIALSNTQEAYIMDNYDRDPIKIDRVITISEYLGEEFKKKYELKFVPERMYVGFCLAQTEKSYHVYGKLTKNQVENRIYWVPKTQVMEDLFYTPVNIEVDFDKYTALDNMGRVPYNHQIDGVKFLLSRDGCILADDMGLGKCISTSESVYCPTGKVKMGDLEVGDYVIGSNGKKTKVTGVYPQPKKELFKITFNDGYYTTCCKEHMWSVTSNNGSVNNKNRPVKYSNLTIEQMLDKDLELEQKGVGHNKNKVYKFKTFYKQSNGQNKWQIPIVQPIEFENHDALPIDSYLLGVSLGDGHIKENGVITIELGDYDFEEIFENQVLNEIKGGVNKRRNQINTLREEIIGLNLNGTLSHTKFIPDVYKYSSIENRIAILQGLMDTDGYCAKSDKGIFVSTEYCTVSKRLADDVVEIVHSLGGIVRMRTKIGSYKKPDGTKVLCKKAYRLNIKFSNDINPFRLKRKANEYNPPQKYKVGRYIKNIESIGDGDSVCIKVDAADELFTLNHGIVTHNTYQTIIAALEAGVEKILIICPSSVKINWKRELKMFGETDISIVDSARWKPAKWTIINYDILKNFHTITPKTIAERDAIEYYNREIWNENYGLIVADEGHKLKDHKSNRGAIVGELSKNPATKRVWLLTGTPVANRPKDFYNLLKLIKSPLADNYPFYVRRYCDGKMLHRSMGSGDNKWVKKTLIANGHSNLDELALRSKNYVMRRLKKDVLDMPDKIVTPVHHELTKAQWDEYNYLWEDYLEMRKKAKKKGGAPSKNLVEVILLRKFIAMTAIKQTIEMVEDAIDEGQKVVIFTTFNEEQAELAEYFGKKCVTHNGSMSAADKQKSVDKFQNNKTTKVFIGNIISAGVGITLTEGTVVVFNSFDWVPGNNEQAEDRTYRIGQKFTVNVYYQLFDDTITTKMWYTVQKKRDVIDQIIGTGSNDDVVNFVDFVIEED